MAASSTYRQILIELAERYGLGRVVTLSSQTTTTLVLTTEGSPELRGPFSAATIPVGSPVVMTVETSGTDVLGDRTFVSNWAPASGTVTVSPAIGGTDGTEAIIFHPWIKDADRVLEAVNRALRNRCRRWVRVPFTKAGRGADLRGVVGDWTLSNATAAYTDWAGSTYEGHIDRSITVTNTAINGYVHTGSIGVQPEETWYFNVSMLSDGTSTARITIRDVTNGTNITPTYTEGAATTTRFSWQLSEGYFEIPSGCYQIQFRLGIDENSVSVDFSPLVAAPNGTTQYPLGYWLQDENSVGNLFTVDYIPTTETGSMDSARWCDYIVPHRLQTFSDGPVVDFEWAPPFPLYYEALVSADALTSMTSTTPVELDRVCRWAMFELYDRLMRDEMHERARADNGSLLSSQFRIMRNAALKQAQWSMHEPKLNYVRGRA